jgi:hypothetical protein
VSNVPLVYADRLGLDPQVPSGTGKPSSSRPDPLDIYVEIRHVQKHEIPKSIHELAAQQRADAWERYHEATNIIDKAAHLVFGVGLNYIGEGFALVGSYVGAYAHQIRFLLTWGTRAR